MKHAYCRCNSGHYFVGEYCPIDGWSSIASRELDAASKQLVSFGLEPSLAELRKLQVSDDTLKRTIVIEFGTDTSAFEAISPEGYVINGKWKRLLDIDRSFK